jgi:hypothetical protein
MLIPVQGHPVEFCGRKDASFRDLTSGAVQASIPALKAPPPSPVGKNITIIGCPINLIYFVFRSCGHFVFYEYIKYSFITLACIKKNIN